MSKNVDELLLHGHEILLVEDNDTCGRIADGPKHEADIDDMNPGFAVEYNNFESSPHWGSEA